MVLAVHGVSDVFFLFLYTCLPFLSLDEDDNNKTDNLRYSHFLLRIKYLSFATIQFFSCTFWNSLEELMAKRVGVRSAMVEIFVFFYSVCILYECICAMGVLWKEMKFSKITWVYHKIIVTIVLKTSLFSRKLTHFSRLELHKNIVKE